MLLAAEKQRNSTEIGRLPLVGPLQLSFVQSMPERLFPLLALPGEKIAVDWYGPETIVRFHGDVLVVENALFRRYVFGVVDCVSYVDGVLKPCKAGAMPMGTAALEVRKARSMRSRPLLERIYVMPNLRRQGLGSHLLASAKSDFPNLALDGKLTREGAAFFHYDLKTP